MQFNFFKKKKELSKNTESEVAIYYPYIDFNDANLIKTAALYWDEIQTIVPANYRNPYQYPISKEAFDNKFLKPYIVSGDDDKEVEQTVNEFIDDIQQPQIQKHLSELIAQDKQHDHEGITRIHIDKLGVGCIRHLAEAIKQKLKEDKDGFIELPRIIGDAYMSRLVSVIANHNNVAPLTNISSFHNVVIDRYINYDNSSRKTQAELAKLSLQTF